MEKADLGKHYLLLHQAGVRIWRYINDRTVVEAAFYILCRKIWRTLYSPYSTVTSACGFLVSSIGLLYLWPWPTENMFSIRMEIYNWRLLYFTHNTLYSFCTLF